MYRNQQKRKSSKELFLPADKRTYLSGIPPWLQDLPHLPKLSLQLYAFSIFFGFVPSCFLLAFSVFLLSSSAAFLASASFIFPCSASVFDFRAARFDSPAARLSCCGLSFAVRVLSSVERVFSCIRSTKLVWVNKRFKTRDYLRYRVHP